MTTIGSNPYSRSAYPRSTGTSGKAASGEDTPVSAGIPVNEAKRIDISNMVVSYYGSNFEDVYPGATLFVKWAHEGDTSPRPDIPDAPPHPGLKAYATVTVNGETVATIDSFGMVKAKAGIFSGIRETLKAVDAATDAKNGPALAQARADAIAAALGGEVAQADTALTQAQFDAASKAGARGGQADPDSFFALLDKVSAAA